jgi:tRNA(Arg) A34 adenosine deaminase TadA
MDAILSATRSGEGTVGTRLYVTTFPCHYCARHIVAAGVDEVQYIEPYPKSRALKLHADAISTTAPEWMPPSRGGDKVLMRPFTGIAPRLYERVFSKELDLKDESGRMKIGDFAWGDPWKVHRVSYAQLEAELAREVEEEGAQ